MCACFHVDEDIFKNLLKWMCFFFFLITAENFCFKNIYLFGISIRESFIFFGHRPEVMAMAEWKCWRTEKSAVSLLHSVFSLAQHKHGSVCESSDKRLQSEDIVMIVLTWLHLQAWKLWTLALKPPLRQAADPAIATCLKFIVKLQANKWPEWDFLKMAATLEADQRCILFRAFSEYGW